MAGALRKGMGPPKGRATRVLKAQRMEEFPGPAHRTRAKRTVANQVKFGDRESRGKRRGKGSL